MRFALSVAVVLTASLQAAQAQNTPRGDTDRWFGGKQCLRDCTRHQAGYRWALETGVNSYEACPQFEGKSFLLGCRVYVDDPYRDPNYDDNEKRIRRR